VVEWERQLTLGRDAFAGSAWRRAYEALAAADALAPLHPRDLERLGRSAYMIGRDDDYVSALERAHQAYLAAQEVRAAASHA
jgi:hypothetical protein